MANVPPRTLQNARRLRAHPTDVEVLLWRALRRGTLGGRFRRQHPIPPYIADFACVQSRLVIELDGGQHAGAAADRRRTAYLEARGWRVLRFWNHDVLQNIDGTLEMIKAALDAPLPRHPHPNPPPAELGEGLTS